MSAPRPSRLRRPCRACGRVTLHTRHGASWVCAPCMARLFLGATVTPREYLARLPASIPPGRVLVPHAMRAARCGFRAWLEVSAPDRLTVCPRGWADELGVHYRVPGR